MRFDLIHPPVPDLAAWERAARDAGARGYAAVLCPEVPAAVDPFRALSAVAAAAPEVRIGTHVLAATLHEPQELAARLSALERQAPGRLDVGLGTGRPQTRTAGGPSGGELRRRLERTVQLVRQDCPGAPLTLAAQGPRALALAGQLADELSLALPPDATEADLAAAAQQARQGRSRPLGLALTLVGVGDELTDWHARRLTAATLRDGNAVALLPADPGAAEALLARWHTELGVTRVLVDPSLIVAAQPHLDRAA